MTGSRAGAAPVTRGLADGALLFSFTNSNLFCQNGGIYLPARPQPAPGVRFSPAQMPQPATAASANEISTS
jgi:hypothetical protein